MRKALIVDAALKPGGHFSHAIVANGFVYVSGQGQYQVNQGNAQTDDFIAFVQTQDQPYQNQNAGPAPNYVSPEMTGYQDLNRYGQWGQDQSYGQVWYPQVAADWAPYRNGHWAYVSPWGWTWIDDAPWGFTPFHYWRWVQVTKPAMQEVRAEIIKDLDQRTYNVFFVPEAQGHPSIPAQDFVARYGVKSALGFGGILPSGNLFAVIMFTRVAIPLSTAQMFRTLALNVKLNILPFANGPIFNDGVAQPITPERSL